jgi:hypothetical protein
LQRFARRIQPVRERCETCATPLDLHHPHLFDPARDQLACSCEACALCVPAGMQRVPARVRVLPKLMLPTADWRALGIPVELAFVRATSPAGVVVAEYPGPGGATRTELHADVWAGVCRHEPALRDLQRDVEALLADRRGAEARYYVAPIDACYRLVGLVRTAYAGPGGGAALQATLRTFFAELEARAEVDHG